MSFDENELYHIEEWTDQSPYIISYYGKIKHLGLDRLLILKDFNQDHLKSRIKSQQHTWNAIWKLEQYKTETEPNASYSHELADQLTALAKSNLRVVKDLLLESLRSKIRLDWDKLKDRTVFPTANPEPDLLAQIDNIPLPVEPLFKELPQDVNEDAFAPELGFFDKLFGARAKRKKDEASENYNKAIAQWELEVARVEEENRVLRNDYLAKLAEAETLKKDLTKQCELKVYEWHAKYKAFYDKKDQHNRAIDQWKADFMAGKKEAVETYFNYILHCSAYPDLVSKVFLLDFKEDEKTLVVDYLLPTPQKFPHVSEVRYVPLRGLLKDSDLSDRQFSRVYHDAIYKMPLRTIYEIFESDTSGAIEYVAYNGWVDYEDEERQEQRCLISLMVSKDDFNALNLQYTDSKICFEELNGREGTDLMAMEPVEPYIVSASELSLTG